jgi:hypothetical protein
VRGGGGGEEEAGGRRRRREAGGLPERLDTVSHTRGVEWDGRRCRAPAYRATIDTACTRKTHMVQQVLVVLEAVQDPGPQCALERLRIVGGDDIPRLGGALVHVINRREVVVFNVPCKRCVHHSIVCRVGQWVGRGEVTTQLTRERRLEKKTGTQVAQEGVRRAAGTCACVCVRVGGTRACLAFARWRMFAHVCVGRVPEGAPSTSAHHTHSHTYTAMGQ